MPQELACHGGDPQATLAATMDGRSLEAIGEIAGAGGVPGAIEAKLARRRGRAGTSCWGGSRRARPRPASATR